MDGDTDDLNAAASAAAESVISKKQSLKEAAEDLVERMNSINNGLDKKPEKTSPSPIDDVVQEIGKLKKDAIQKEQANENSKNAMLKNPKNASLKKALDDKAKAIEDESKAEEKKIETEMKAE